MVVWQRKVHSLNIGTYSPEFVEGVFSGIQGMLGLWTGSLMSVVVRSAEAGLKGAKGG